MKKYVSLDKRSKKEQKAYYAAQRSSWGLIDPATITMPSKKGYDRNKVKQNDRKGRLSWQDDSRSFNLRFVPAVSQL